MPVDRPTFSESWYRVANLCPRLRSTVQVYRQHFRAQMWHVLEDPSSNQFFRLNEPAYRFVAMLDGKHTVADVWRMCNEQLGDSAPTQGETIQLLGQLYTSNLLQSELPPDAEGLFRRYSKRRGREVKGYLSNLLFIRIPLFDPDAFLDRWVSVAGSIFTAYGLAVWAVIVSIGLYSIAGRGGELMDQASGILAPDKLLWLYVSFVLVKAFHEFGHAFSCKKFGRQAGTGGEVHVMGVMFLVFTPLPYVDASSSWALRSKWHRIVVGAGGMFVELAIAAIAAVVWANTATGSTAHAIAYNVMFIASVSTLLFNGNPLLRYDAYYILSDMLEIPNLAQRSKQYLYYLVKRHVWSVRHAVSPAHTSGEKAWFVFYGVASTAYRVFICAAILLFVADKFFVVGAVLAVAAVVMWVFVPLGKFAHYLATSGELLRVRTRAVATTAATLTAIFVGVGLIPAPDRCRVEGVVEPVRQAIIHAAVDGFVEEFLPSGRAVSPDGEPLIRAVNRQLAARESQLLADRRALEVQRRLARTQEAAAVQMFTRQIEALDEQIHRVQEEIGLLELHSPIAGTWISPKISRIKGAYVRRGDRLGLVASLDERVIRVTAGQEIAAPLIDLVRQGVEIPIEIRVKGRPDILMPGRLQRILPAGLRQLPSAALGYPAGGSVRTAADDRRGTRAAERFFEIRIVPGKDAGRKWNRLLSGQRVVARFEMPSRPLALQWWRSLQQLVQRRFHI